MSRYTHEQRRTLLHVARASIGHGLRHGEPPTLEVAVFDEPLCEARATFVTLRQSDQLRGCIGALEPTRPLVQDVAAHAFAAAFTDPRFSPLTHAELAEVSISIAVLNAPEAIECEDESALLAQLRPQIDGLILEETQHYRRATFLPVVWESLPEPADFVAQLKLKAGLPDDYWSPSLRVLRYTTECIEEV